MAVPTVEKTYQFDVNNVIASETEVPFYQKLLHGVKEAMIGFATLPWTVISSSDSATAGAGDKWVASTNLVWASSGAHSWIVLQQGAGGGQLCIDLFKSAGQTEDMFAFWSAGGNFTGGTISARPTATDEIDIVVAANSAWCGSQTGTPAQTIYHVMHSTDGLVDRVMFCTAGLAHSWWRFEPIKNPRAAHTNNPTQAIISGGSTAEPTIANLRGVGESPRTEKDGTGTSIVLFLATVSGSNVISLVEDAIAGVSEEWDNELYAVEEHWICTTVGHRGPKGSSYDAWYGQSAITVTGDTMPNSTTVREFVNWGVFVWPWTGDATIPQVS